MRRLSLLIALVAATCGTPSLVFAQRHAPRAHRARVDTVVVVKYELPPNAIGTTYCTADSNVVVAIDARVLDSVPLAVETLVHEKQHQREMRANPALCDPLPFQLLGMEVRAYCADADSGVLQFHEPPTEAYFARLNSLLLQFSDERESGSTVTDMDVRLAWFKECSRYLVGKVAP